MMGARVAAICRAAFVPVARIAWIASTAYFACIAAPAPSLAADRLGDAWLDRVRVFEPGTSSGFGADQLPGIVLGPPEGGGMLKGSLDVVSLGNGGSITVAFADNVVVDGEGDDLVIFENAFFGGDLLFAELAFVEVSADARQWFAFPYDPDTHAGLAGRTPVLANSENGLDPLAPESGGDRFDLADVGLEFARFVRITDAGDLIDDPGNHSFAGTKGGFDLDAVAAIHWIGLGCIAGRVTADGVAVAGARVHVEAEGERSRRRVTRTNGRYRVCRLTPGRDYDVRSEVADVGSAAEIVHVDEDHLRVTVDLDLR
ncbi:MAG TPA: hypothetical protein VN634_18805 [Candidatus Limnocylindrales bacterium]|nr:hypothetical protein [Candidatus Limnocylindrales bacterium]